MVTRDDRTTAMPPARKAVKREQRVRGRVGQGEDPHAEGADAQQGGRDQDGLAPQGPVGEPGASQDHGPGDQHGDVEDGRRGLQHDAVGRLGGAQVADGVGVGGVDARVQRLGGDEPHQDRGAGEREQHPRDPGVPGPSLRRRGSGRRHPGPGHLACGSCCSVLVRAAIVLSSLLGTGSALSLLGPGAARGRAGGDEGERLLRRPSAAPGMASARIVGGDVPGEVCHPTA